MIRPMVCAAVFTVLSLPLYAVDPGRAEGTITIGSERMNLAYAYAVGGQKNETTGRSDDVRIIVTDKPLPDGFDLKMIESAFPEGIIGVVFDIDNDRQPAHVFVQLRDGMYDGGYFSKTDVYRFRGKFVDGSVEGRVSAKRVTTSTTTIAFDVNFAAMIQ